MSARANAIVTMIGAGQLARMTHQAAIDYAITLHVLASSASDPAVLAGADHTVGRPDRYGDLEAAASFGDVVTFDHELVPTALLYRLEEAGHVLRPTPAALAFAQDKLLARRTLADLGEAGFMGKTGIPGDADTDADTLVPAFAEARSARDAYAFAAEHGWPVVLKARGGGYDGRGVHILRSPTETARMLPEAPEGPEPGWVLEEHLDLAAELSILVARRPSGEVASYPPVGTQQEDGMCRELTLPARLSEGAGRAATDLAESLVASLGVVGVCAVELFQTSDGRLLVNELAMRPHNSGHITIEACETSQFHQHLRAVLDWPLGSTALRSPAATVNLIGGPAGIDPIDGCSRALGVHGAHVHLYAKEPRAGRKLGHVTALGSDVEEALEIAREAARLVLAPA